MKYRYLFYRLIALSVSVAVYFTQPTHAQDVTQITDMVLITGQSNVRGSLTNFDQNLDEIDLKVFAYTSADVWEIADLHQAWDVNGWEPGNGSIQDPGREPYNNFAFHFAKTVTQADPTRVVGIIIASAPGKGISHWNQDSEFSVAVSNKVVTALSAQGVKSSLDAILWHQGETDWLLNGTSDTQATTEEQSDPDYYPNKLADLITRFRSQSWFSPNKAFICGETKAAPVNAHLMGLNNDGDNSTGCVSATDLTTRDANTHFDADGLRELGQRYGLKYIEMLDNTQPNFPSPTTLISPSGITNTNMPTYTWNAVSNSTWYYLSVSDSQGSSFAKWYKASDANCANGIGSCNVTPTNNVSADVNWKVRTWNQQGDGPWSSTFSFSVENTSVDATTLISPSNTTNTQTPEYSWNAVPASTWYYLSVSDNAGGSFVKWYTASDANCGGSNATCSVIPTNQVTGEISWKVRTWKQSTGNGPWSTTFTFTVNANIPNTAITISPNSVITTNTPAYTWHAVENSTWYYLWINDSTGTPLKKWYKASEVNCAAGTGICSIIPATAVTGDSTWWVRTWNTSGHGPWSSAMSFVAAP